MIYRLKAIEYFNFYKYKLKNNRDAVRKASRKKLNLVFLLLRL